MTRNRFHVLLSGIGMKTRRMSSRNQERAKLLKIVVWHVFNFHIKAWLHRY